MIFKGLFQLGYYSVVLYHIASHPIPTWSLWWPCQYYSFETSVFFCIVKFAVGIFQLDLVTYISYNNVYLYMVDTPDFHTLSHAYCFERALDDQGEAEFSVTDVSVSWI